MAVDFTFDETVVQSLPRKTRISLDGKERKYYEFFYEVQMNAGPTALEFVCVVNDHVCGARSVNYPDDHQLVPVEN